MMAKDVRGSRRKTQENLVCNMNGNGKTYPVLEISAKGFSFLCRKDENPFQTWETVDRVTILSAEGREIIAGAGTVVHVTETDFLHSQVGFSFTKKIMDRTMPGTIRVPRRYPRVRMDARLKPEESNGSAAVHGTVRDFTATTMRIGFDEGSAPGIRVGDVVSVTLSAGEAVLPEADANVVRKRGDGSEIIVQFVDEALDISRVEAVSNALQSREIFFSALDSLDEFRNISGEFKALIGEWRFTLANLKEALDREEAKNLYPLEPDKELFLKGLESRVMPLLEDFILRFNKIAGGLGETEAVPYKKYFRENLNYYFRQSPYAASVIDKEKGYSGDYETIKYFFQNPYLGDTLFGKLMNKHQVSLDAVMAHQDRIQFLSNLLSSLYAESGDDFSFLSLGSGPAEEVLRYVSNTTFERPVHGVLIDMDAFALADLSERLQYHPKDNFTLDLINGNLLQIVRGKSSDPVAVTFPLTYCAGLFDYFKDIFCRKVVKYLIRHTRPGGTVIVTNVHTRNRTRHFMDYCGGWEIVHRDEDQMLGLVPEGYDTELFYDRNRVNIILKIAVPRNPS